MLSPCASFVFASSVPSSFASSSTPSCPRAWAAAGTGSGSRRLGNRRLLQGAGGARTSPAGPRRGREGRSASAAAEGGKARESPPDGGLGGGRPTGRCGLDPGYEFASVDGPCCARVFIGGEGTQGRAWTAGLREACWIPARSVSGARGDGGAEVGAGYGRERCCQPQREGAMMASTVVSPGLCGMVEAGGVEPPFPPQRADSATLSAPWRSLPAPP